MSTRNLAMTAATVVAMAACSVATVTVWLLLTAPTRVALQFYDAFAHLVQML